MTKYIRFLTAYVPLFTTLAGFFLGGAWMWLGFLVSYWFSILGDALFGEDTSTPEFRDGRPLDLMLYFAVPGMIAVLVSFAWTFAAGDPLGLGAAVTALTGYDALAAKASNGAFAYVGAVMSAGIAFAYIGTNVGHELCHRTWDRLALATGRWLLALSWDAQFAIEHVYGHHTHVCTPKDPATARRGETVYGFVVRSTFGQMASAWEIEARRLGRLTKPVWSPANRIIRGHLMSLALLAACVAIGGPWAGAAFVGAAIYAKLYLEIVNYMEHYGLVRVPGTPVQPHHSWNTNRRISSILLFNLTRHSDHHANAGRPYWQLRPYEGAPRMPFGYLTTIVVTLVPPLWHRIMVPKLRHWDEHYATPAERQLAAEANARSGVKALAAPVLTPAAAAA